MPTFPTMKLSQWVTGGQTRPDAGLICNSSLLNNDNISLWNVEYKVGWRVKNTKQ